MKYISKILLSAVLAVSLQANSVDKKELNDGEITLAFTNTPLSDVIKFVAKSSKANILLNDNISGNVNFISNQPIKSKDLLSFLDNILRIKGYTLLENNAGYYEISRVAQAKSQAVLNNKTDIGMTIKIKKLKYLKPSVAAGKIRHLLSQYATVTHDDANSLLIIDDYPDQIDNVSKVLNALDTRVKRNVEVIELKNYSAQSAYKQLEPMLKNSKSLYKHPVTFVPNNYANSIAVFANKEDMAKATSIVHDFDTQKNLHSVTTKIIFLKNGQAKEVSTMVTKLLSTIDINSPIKTNVSFNEELNAIILAGSYTQIDILKDIIEELDIEKRQVFLKANIYEISENDADKMGIKWGAAAGSDQGNIIATTALGLGGSAFVLPDEILSGLDLTDKAVAVGATIDFLKTNGAVNTISE
ncbi:MAG: secretin N-terminal domain-containing protein, partial [Campylobacterota bacterium]|nr:secretin N-terminal domain-containing protein [Campylobacterota bacterium]